MRVSICCVGRLRQGPEHDLITDYLTRFDRTGRALGLTLGDVIEVEDKKNQGMKAEGDLLRRALPKSALIWALDERGETLSSPEFATGLGQVRDQGTSDLALIIGGADGIEPNLRGEATRRISFGRMVWPHMLVRVMLSEQLYRAASILAGAPYHRV